MPKVVKDLTPLLKIYDDGTIERLQGTDKVLPFDPNHQVLSKDALYCSQHNLSARIYLPKTVSDEKLPLVIYYHGGGFVVQNAFSAIYHNYLNSLVAKANVIAVSVDYRLAPEHPYPSAYDDSWNALKWVASHSNAKGPEKYLNLHADFDKVFLAGDSAGANISHYLAMKSGQDGKLQLHGVNIQGIALVNPYFWGRERIGNESNDPEWIWKLATLWDLSHPGKSLDDPVINPACDLNLAILGCLRVLVFVAELDILRDRGWLYYETLKMSGWGYDPSVLDIDETEGEDHVFHLVKPDSEKALLMIQKISSFFNC